MSKANSYFFPASSKTDTAVRFRSPSPVMSVNADHISQSLGAKSPATAQKNSSAPSTHTKSPKPNLKLNFNKTFSPSNRSFAQIANQNANLNPGPFSPGLFTGKRVWVKRPHGAATTIVVNQYDIIDDLKSAIITKFPNAIGKYFDPADITIKMDLHSRNAGLVTTGSQHTSSHKKAAVWSSAISPENPKPGLNSPVTATNRDSNSSFNFINLEPDQNVWNLLELYFPNGMNIAEALVIETPELEDVDLTPRPVNQRVAYSQANQGQYTHMYQSSASPSFQQSQPHHRSTTPNSVNSVGYYQPKPQYSSYHSNINYDAQSKDRSVSPSTGPNSKAAPMTSSIPLHHRRSQSNPPQSPIINSTAKANNAVLLLPKNFSSSNGQIHSSSNKTNQANASATSVVKKRLSLDENLVSKTASSTLASSGPQSNKAAHAAPTPFPSLPNNGKREEPELETAKSSLSVENGNVTRDDSITPDPVIPERSAGKDEDVRVKVPQKQEKRVSSGENHDKTGKVSRQSSGSKRKDDYKSRTATETVLPSISVLVVEDNAINQAILGAFLRKHKIHYEIAKNGQEAMDKWRRGGFHLVLMDIQLPVKSGIEATKEIRYLERINRIGVFAENEIAGTNPEDLPEEDKLDLEVFRSPVIIVALTASSNASVDRSNALRAGCNDYLTKPVNLVWLQNKITEWGCMQALIDFNGWKTKRSNFNRSSSRILSSTARSRSRSGSQVILGQRPKTAAKPDGAAIAN